MLGLASRPKLERLPLELADQLRCLGTFPLSGVAMLPGATDPAALPRQAVRLAHHQHREFGLPALLGAVVDIGEHLAQGAHLGAGEMVTEQPEHFGIGYRNATPRGCDQDCTDLQRVGQQSGAVVHPSGCRATGVSSNTSSLDVLLGHGMTSRHLNGPMRSSTPAMSRLGLSP